MQWQFVPMQFTQGLSQKTDDKQPTNQWLKLENVVMEKSGKFQKRRGVTKGTNSTGATTIAQTAENKAKLLPLPTDSAIRFGSFIDLGMPTPELNFALGACSISRSGQFATMFMVPYIGLQYNTYFRKYDATNKDIVSESSAYILDRTAVKSSYAGVSDTTRCCFVVVADGSISGFVSAGVFVWDDGTLVAIDTGFATGSRKNLSAHGYGDYIFIAYSDITNTNTKLLRYNLTTQTIDKSTTIAENNVETHVSCDGTYVWVTTGTSYRRFNMDFTTISINRNTTYTLKAVSRGGFMFAYESGSAGGIVTDIINGTTGTTTKQYKGIINAQVQPFTFNGTDYIVVTQNNPGYPNFWPGGHMVLNMSNPTGEIACGFLYGFMANSLAQSQPLGGLIPLPTSTTFKVVNIVSSTVTNAVSISGDLIYDAGGARYSRGDKSVPLGFHYTSWAPTVTDGGAAGTFAAGTYQILVVLEDTTPHGNVMRSVPSQITELTLANSNRYINVYFDIPTVETDRYSSATASVYIKTPTSSVFVSLKRNLPLIGVTYAFSAIPVDAVTLYTSTGALEDLPPPATINGVSFANNRMWTMSAESAEIRFTDYLFPGELPLFVEAFSLPLPQGYGEGIIVTELDGKIVVFQKYAVSATYGSGPDQTGANNYPPLQIIARSIGAIVPKSVISTNEGIFFLSSKGLWIVDRSLTVQFIGAPVEDDSPNIIAAAKLTDTEQIWFFTPTKAIIYDAYHKLWTTAPLGISGITDARVIDGVLHVVAGGYDYTLSGTADDTGAITVKLTTGWMSLAGLQGFERFRRISFLASQVASNTMTVTLRYDFSSTDFETFTCASAALITTGDTVQWQIRPRRQKCESLQLEISYAGTTGGVSFSSFAIEVGMIGLSNRLKTTNRVKGN